MTKRRLTRRQRKVRRNRIILACAAAALLIIIIVIISVSMKGCSKSKKTDKNGESTTAKVEESTQTKENESSSEEPASTNADNSSVTTANATSVSASSDSSEFVPPVVPSGNTVSKGTTSKGFQIQEINGATYIDGVLIANKTYALPQDFIPTNPDQPVNADRS